MTIMVTQTLRKAAQHDPCYFFKGRALFYIDSSLPDSSERPDFFELEIERPSIAQCAGQIDKKHTVNPRPRLAQHACHVMSMMSMPYVIWINGEFMFGTIQVTFWRLKCGSFKWSGSRGCHFLLAPPHQHFNDPWDFLPSCTFLKTHFGSVAWWQMMGVPQANSRVVGLETETMYHDVACASLIILKIKSPWLAWEGSFLTFRWLRSWLVWLHCLWGPTGPTGPRRSFLQAGDEVVMSCVFVVWVGHGWTP